LPIFFRISFSLSPSFVKIGSKLVIPPSEIETREYGLERGNRSVPSNANASGSSGPRVASVGGGVEIGFGCEGDIATGDVQRKKEMKEVE